MVGLCSARSKGKCTRYDDGEDRLRLLRRWSARLPTAFMPRAITWTLAPNTLCFVCKTIPSGNSRIETLASGWGYSSDYHDWAVGLPRNERGEYFLGIPCQQDKRSPPPRGFMATSCGCCRASRRPKTHDLFALVVDLRWSSLSDGPGSRPRRRAIRHRQSGQLQTVQRIEPRPRRAHFGFINFLERGKPMPLRTPPAIDIPHPWTRSVNGICFLYTPKKLRRAVFGPLEGHLIGCEYDTGAA